MYFCSICLLFLLYVPSYVFIIHKSQELLEHVDVNAADGVFPNLPEAPIYLLEEGLLA